MACAKGEGGTRPRFKLDASGADAAAKACVKALDGESDREVKVVIVEALRALLKWEGEAGGAQVTKRVEVLRGGNERAWKAVVAVDQEDEKKKGRLRQPTHPPPARSNAGGAAPGGKPPANKAPTSVVPEAEAQPREEEPNVDDHLSVLSALGVPNFEGGGDDDDETSCVRDQLTDAKWQNRKAGVDTLKRFIDEEPAKVRERVTHLQAIKRAR